MAKVFLSYDRDNAPAARLIAIAVERAGNSVWWDQRMHGGAEFTREIERALDDADAIVVLWSKESIESPWVRDEAASGRDRGRLVPVAIDATPPPLGFRQFHTLRVPGGKLNKARLRELLVAIESVIGVPTPSRVSTTVQWRPPLRWFATATVVAAIAAVLFTWRPWSSEGGEIALAVLPATGDPASRGLANDLTAKLSALNASSAHPVRIIDGTGIEDTDLVISVSTPGAASAALVLKSARDSSIVWSQDFEQPSGKRADLIQQLAFTAARVTGCAAEALNRPVILEESALRTYLKACAQLSEILSASQRPAAPMLLEVLRSEPRFKPAWSKLLLIEAEMTDRRFTAGESDPQLVADLKRHIEQARAIDLNMAEVRVAEAALLPSHDFYGRSQAIAAAAAQSPDDPMIVNLLAGILGATGRHREAVETANKAVLLDPLSPGIRSAFIAQLTYSGSFDAAKRELQKAEKLWPGTTSVLDAQFRFHYRYGDPKVARALFEQQVNAGGRGPRMILATREHPTPAKVRELLNFVRERLRNMENPSAGIGFAILAFGQFGQAEEVISTLLTWPKIEDVATISEVLFRPEFASTRRDKRFMLVAKRAGLLDLWIKSGKWPDFCSEPGQPYDCKAEAVKVS